MKNKYTTRERKIKANAQKPHLRKGLGLCSPESKNTTSILRNLHASHKKCLRDSKGNELDIEMTLLCSNFYPEKTPFDIIAAAQSKFMLDDGSCNGTTSLRWHKKGHFSLLEAYGNCDTESSSCTLTTDLYASNDTNPMLVSNISHFLNDELNHYDKSEDASLNFSPRFFGLFVAGVFSICMLAYIGMRVKECCERRLARGQHTPAATSTVWVGNNSNEQTWLLREQQKRDQGLER